MIILHCGKIARTLCKPVLGNIFSAKKVEAISENKCWHSVQICYVATHIIKIKAELNLFFGIVVSASFAIDLSILKSCVTNWIDTFEF